ncbi:hypothetical protein OIW_02778 [Enterococcus faecium EnGen0040]|nr:hypothetical protein OIW_02778 [Enterococcus faecium EnGen0040]
MRFFTTFTIIMIAVLFIFLDIAKRNTAFLLYRVLLRAGLITFISIVGFFSIHSYCIYLENSSTTIARDYIWRISF